MRGGHHIRWCRPLFPIIFRNLRTDVEGAYYGFYFMDLAGYYAREANDETETLKLLYQTLRALTNIHIPNRTDTVHLRIEDRFVNGEGPQVMECIMCGIGAGKSI